MMLDNLLSMVDVLGNTDSTLFGPTVKVIRTLASGDTVEEHMPASLAVDSVLRDPINGGEEVISARVVWPEEAIDVWGMSI